MKLIYLGLMIVLVQFCYGQTTDTYQYDGNGNMIADSHNNIAFIQYDVNNLPITIYKTDGTKIEYAYDASGERVRKTVGTENTYYVHGADGKTEAVAKDDPAATVFHIDDIGRAERQGSNWIRSYYLKDHLGSIRMTLSDNGSVIGYDDYYPFGMIMPGRSGNSGNGAGRYKFTGKERDVETQFDYFGARYYDSRIGRWLSVDPLAEKYIGWSPYNYVKNNPIKHYDPDGRILKFAPGSSKAYKKDYQETEIYLRSHGAAADIDQIKNSSKTYYIGDASGTGQFNSKSSTILWSPHTGAINAKGKKLSPSIIMSHEFSHAAHFDKNKTQYINDKNTDSDLPKTTVEEKKAIEAETSAARKTGEIGPNEVTRESHAEGTSFPTEGPTSTVEDQSHLDESIKTIVIEPVVVTPRQ